VKKQPILLQLGFQTLQCNKALRMEYKIWRSSGQIRRVMKPIFYFAGVAWMTMMIGSCSTINQLPIINNGKVDPNLFVAKDLTQPNLFTNNIEGPAVFHDSLFVVNYQTDGTIAYVDSTGNCQLYLTLPKGSTGNCIRFDPAGNMYVADFSGHNVLKINRNKEVNVLAHTREFNQPNDLVRSKYGYILASDPDWKDSTGQVWRVEPDGKYYLLAANMGTTNGICLSPDEKTLYVNESDQRKVWAFDIDTMGNVSNKRLFTYFKDYGLDGMHCDKHGNLYICRYGKGVVAIFTAMGDMVREVPLQGKNCSNLTFGGRDGKTVFVTLQDRKGMEQFRTDNPGVGW
jgi:gluconolactonase